jgi:hypothetical protein
VLGTVSTGIHHITYRHGSKKVEGERLKTPIDLNFQRTIQKEDYVVDVVLKYLHAAKTPSFLWMLAPYDTGLSTRSTH